jgi:hypothetical protein
MTRTAPLLVALVALSACATDDTPDAGESGGTTDADTPRVTYYDDALPILAKHCGSCHQDGGIAPFATDDYATAVQWGEAIVGAAMSRTMPPFGVNNDGSCNTFADAQWLSDDELATLSAWIEDGAIEGEAPAEPIVPPEPPTLAGAGIQEVATPEYLPVAQTGPGEEHEDYQCFLVPMGADHDRYVTGFEVIPGNEAIVHHVLGFKVNPTLFGNAQTMQELDDASPDQIGWDCFGAAGENVLVESVPVTWAPGVGAVEFPAGTGIPMTAEDVLVVQVHYNLAAGIEPDSTIVRLQFADEVERPAVQTLWDPFLYSSLFGMPESLPAGMESTKYAWNETISVMTNLPSSGPVEVWGFLPHMHKRGRKMSIQLEQPQGMSCAADVDRYDFGWQRAYFYEEPIHADLADKVHVECDFDTRGDASDVLPGFGTANEMCLVGIYVVPQ